MKKILPILGMIACSCITHAQSLEHAKLSIHKNNIKVWTYQQQSSPVFVYKAETTFNVPLEKAATLILDVDHAVKWVPYVGSVKVLSRDDQKGEFLLYMVLDFPFPLKDRDLVVKGKMSKDAQGIISIQNKAIEGGYPLNPDYVRIQITKATGPFKNWAIKKSKSVPMAMQTLKARFLLSFVNMFVQQQPYQMLQKMKIELSKSGSFKALPEILR